MKDTRHYPYSATVIARARELHADGNDDLAIDDDAQIFRTASGDYWCQAYVYVPGDQLPDDALEG